MHFDRFFPFDNDFQSYMIFPTHRAIWPSGDLKFGSHDKAETSNQKISDKETTISVPLILKDEGIFIFWAS